MWYKLKINFQIRYQTITNMLMYFGYIFILTTHHLVVFQHRFDGIYRRYTTYSGGEDLFGMPITEYPEIQSIRKELNLLQKLYGLYNDVNLKVDGYFDIPWMEVNIEKINLELQEFQNRYERIHLRYQLFCLLLFGKLYMYTNYGNFKIVFLWPDLVEL